MEWWNNVIRGLGTANAPFGFAPVDSPSQGQVDPAYNAGMQMLGNVGMGMLASGEKNPMTALGKSYLVASRNAQQQNKDQYVAAKMLEEADAKKQERARSEEERKRRQEYIQQFPADVQVKMLSIPGYMEKYIEATDPAFQQPTKQTTDMQNFLFAQENPEFAGFLQQNKKADGSADAKSYAPIPFKKKDGTVGYGVPYGDGRFVEVPAPEGSSFLGPFDKAADAAAGKVSGEASSILPAAEITAKTVTKKAQTIIDNKNLDAAVGYDYWRPDWMVPNDVIVLRSQIQELLGGAFLQGVVELQGTGPLTEKEGAAAASAYSRMDQAMKSSNPDDFREALRDYSIAVNTGVEKLAGKAGKPVPDLPVPDLGGQWTTLPNGTRIRQKGQ